MVSRVIWKKTGTREFLKRCSIGYTSHESEENLKLCSNSEKSNVTLGRVFFKLHEKHTIIR